MYCRAYNYLVKTGNVKNISDAHLILLCIKSAYDMHVCIPITYYFFSFYKPSPIIKVQSCAKSFFSHIFLLNNGKRGKKGILGNFRQVWTIFGKLGQVWTRQQIRKWENSKKAERISKENKNLSSNWGEGGGESRV